MDRILVALVVLALMVAACGQPSPRANDSEDVPVKASAWADSERSLADYPVCRDRGVQDVTSVPGAARAGVSEVFVHETIGSAVADLRKHFRNVLAPTAEPEWVSCIAIELLWETTDKKGEGETLGGSFFITGYDADEAATAQRAVEFGMFDPGPPGGEPGQPGNWEPMPDRSRFYRDLDATSFKGNQAEGVRIAWFEGESYFELTGPFSLAEALEIADSVEPDPT